MIADEIALIDLINAHRVSMGLEALQFDRMLTHGARGHSHHHFEHGLFQGQVNPEGQGFLERMNMNGIDVEQSGENVNYGGATPQDVFQQWLASPELRANLERMCFVRVGVGKHQDVWTADFAR